MATMSAPRSITINGRVIAIEGPKDRNRPDDADPEMWLDRTDPKTCWAMRFEPNMHKYACPPGMVETVAGYIPFTDAMRRDFIRQRTDAGLSQHDLSRLIGRAKNYVNHLESGRQKHIDADVYDHLIELCADHRQQEAA